MTPPDSLLTPPAPDQLLNWDKASLGRRFMLFVDTEEEFDWSRPFDRSQTAVTVLRGMRTAQAYFAAAGVAPVYLADYPVLASDAAAAMLGRWRADGAADVGVHLHPWVTPPHEETVNVRNSFAGNLPESLERAKLAAMCTLFEARTGARPLAYRAGRYGIGAHSGQLLAEAGFRLDCSVRSRFDYSAEGGPDFRDLPMRPWRAGQDRTLVELPLSTAYVGAMGALGPALQREGQGAGLMRSALARLGLCARVPLTPEGVSASDCIAAIDRLIDRDDLPVLSFSFHSPTLEPGHTPYARTAADVDAFYGWWDRVLDHLARRSVTPIRLDSFLAAADGARASEAACQAA